MHVKAVQKWSRVVLLEEKNSNAQATGPRSLPIIPTRYATSKSGSVTANVDHNYCFLFIFMSMFRLGT
jgi:hypothetical protein